MQLNREDSQSTEQEATDLTEKQTWKKKSTSCISDAHTFHGVGMPKKI
jgi:hypothetical protein